MKVIGIDLAGKPENPTGFCLLTDEGSQTKLLFSDEEIIKEVEDARPDCIAVDAPLWLPRIGIWRSSDEKLLKKGFQPISPAFPTMRMLVLRASNLVKTLRLGGHNVIEVFTNASEKVLGLSKEPRKNQDEYDALICALTAKAYLEGKCEDLDGIIIPK